MSTDPLQDAIVVPFRGPGEGVKQFVRCANPRCDEQFMLTPGMGRPRRFHDDNCRRRAEQDRRQIQIEIRQHEQQIEQLRAQDGAYLYTQVSAEESPANGPTPAQLQAAREAVLEVKGMARFLAGHQGEFAGDLLRLYEAIAPLVD